MPAASPRDHHPEGTARGGRSSSKRQQDDPVCAFTNRQILVRTARGDETIGRVRSILPLRLREAPFGE